MDESRSILFWLSCSDEIKCIQQFLHKLPMNFKNLEKCAILKKMRKKSTLVKIPSGWCFLKSTRPVYYQLHLHLIKTSLKTIFLKKNHIFAFLTKKTWIERQFFFSERTLNCTYIGKNHFNVISARSEIMSLKGDQGPRTVLMKDCL